MGRTQWSLDGITFNSGMLDADGIEWWITEDSQPLSSPAPTSQYEPKFQRHGSYWVPGYRDKSSETFVIRGYARRGDEAAKARAWFKTLALCQDTTRLYPLVWYSEIGALVKDVTVEGDILIKPIPVQNPGFEASVQLAAPDPRRYSLQWQTYTTGVPQTSLTGLDYGTLGLDYTSGSGAGLDFGLSSSAGQVTLTNTGTAPSTPKLTLYGPLTVPVLTTAAGSIRYNATLAVGEFVVIDPAAPSVLLGGVTSRGYLADIASWASFIVQPGQSLTIGLAHSGASTDLGYVQIDFRSAWW